MLRLSCGSGILRSSRLFSVASQPKYVENVVPKIECNFLKHFDQNNADRDLLVIPFFEPTAKDHDSRTSTLCEAIPTDLEVNMRMQIEKVINKHLFKGSASSLMFTTLPDSPFSVVLAGLGKQPKQPAFRTDLSCRSNNIGKAESMIGKVICNLAKETNCVSMNVILPEGVRNSLCSKTLSLSLHNSMYADTRFKKSPSEAAALCQVNFYGCDTTTDGGEDVGPTVDGVYFAKDLVNAPANYKTPPAIAKLAHDMATSFNLDCEVLGKSECESMGMGGYLGVQQGSRFPPAFVHLTYRPPPSTDKKTVVALVGKGLTFDSGGYNLKVGASQIELMKFDMGGCASVLGCAKVIAQLKPKNVEVHFISAVCENMINENAMRPGDILTASNGKTMEVINTDAEGRLTIADALVFADQHVKADIIIDLATLTGACVAGLGEEIAAMYSNSDKLSDALLQAAENTKEKLWPMPLEEDYLKGITGKSLSDVMNSGGKGGGSITAALFLREFVQTAEEVAADVEGRGAHGGPAQWAHIDMAGPVWANDQATGYGVKLLSNYIMNFDK